MTATLATTPTTVDTVVWDMGGIFRQFPTEAMVEYGQAHDWPLQCLPLGPTGLVDDPTYRALGEGAMVEADYFDLVVATLADHDIDFDPRDVPRSFYRPREVVWELLTTLARRPDRRQAILTNDATGWLGEYWWETWQHRHLFDAIVDAGHRGTRKPAAEPYEAVLAELDVDPGRCVFVDDMPCNVRAARDVGMHGVWFDITDPDSSVASLRRMIEP